MKFKVPRDLNKMNAFTLQICIILLVRFITLTFIANIEEKKEKHSLGIIISMSFGKHDTSGYLPMKRKSCTFSHDDVFIAQVLLLEEEYC